MNAAVKYVAPIWSAITDWGYAVRECDLVNGRHTNHRTVASASGYPTRTEALTAGQDASVADLVEAELLEADRARNVDKAERLAAANFATAMDLQIQMQNCCLGGAA